MPDIQNNFVQSKMNQDLDDRLVPKGEYRTAQNVAISRSQGEDVGALENIEGNNIIANAGLSSYENLDVIGYYVDPSENNVYFFLTDYVDSSLDGISNFAPTTANCFIYSFNNISNTFTRLVQGYFLNFSKNSPIYGISIIEDLLFFTDYRNQPRKINVKLANTSSSNLNPSYYTTEDQISVAKYAPYEPVKFIDLAYNNNLRSTLSNPSQEFLTINMSSGIVAPVGTVTTATFTAISGTTYVPTVGSKIISKSNADLNGKIVLTATATTVTFSGAVTLIVGDDIAFAQPNPEYDENFGGDPEYLSTKFVRFSYRFVFDDGEYSLIAPFSQVCYIPKQNGYFITEDSEQAYRSSIIRFMENNVAQAILNIKMPCEWISDTDNPQTKFHINQVEILYKESDQISIKSVESIPIADVLSNMKLNANKEIYTYTYISTKPYRTLPSDQITRVYDKVPVRAFSQEAVSNRIIYGNFIDKHTSPSSLNYGVGQGFKTGYSTASGIYSQIEFPSSTLKQNRNYQVGVVLSDRYGRSSTTILSSRDKKITPGGSTQSYIGSTLYNPYQTPSVLNFPGLALKVLFDTAENSNAVIPESISGLQGYPGVYIPIGAVDTFSAFAAGTGYPASVTNQEAETTGGSGTGLTVNITTNGSGVITALPIINKAGEGYVEGDVVNISGGSNGTVTVQFLKEPNPLGWYSYKLVVRQTEQDYYNVYVPGILDGYPDPQTPSTFPTNETGSTSHMVLLNDNINKVPRDLNEVGPEQRKFRSSVELFGRVVNTQPVAGVSFSNQYQPDVLPDTVSIIADTDDLDFTAANLSSFGEESFYQFIIKPSIARISTGKTLGAKGASNNTSMIPQLAVLETEAVESSLDIYYETSTTGLVEDLNNISATTGSIPVGFTAANYTQNESDPIGTDVLGSAGSRIRAVDFNGNTITNRTYSLVNVVDGNGSLLQYNNASTGPVIPFPFTLTSDPAGAGFYISTTAFFPFSSVAANNTFIFTIACSLVSDPSVSTNLNITGTLTNSLPNIGTFPATLSVSSTGAISGSSFNTGSTNGVNAGALAADKKVGLQYSIEPGGVLNSSSVTDSNNYGFTILSDGTQISLNSYPTPGTYAVTVTLTDGGGLTDTETTSVTVNPQNNVPFRFWFDYLATNSTQAIKLETSFFFSGTPYSIPLTTLIGGSSGATPTGSIGSSTQGEYRYSSSSGLLTSYPPTNVPKIVSSSSGNGYSNGSLSLLSTSYNSTPPPPQNGSGLAVDAFSNALGQLRVSNPNTIQIVSPGNAQYQTGEFLNILGTSGTNSVIELDLGTRMEARVNGVSAGSLASIPSGTKLEIQLWRGTPGVTGALAIGTKVTLNSGSLIYQSGFWTQLIEGTNLNNGNVDGYTIYMQLKNQ